MVGVCVGMVWADSMLPHERVFAGFSEQDSGDGGLSAALGLDLFVGVDKDVEEAERVMLES